MDEHRHLVGLSPIAELSTAVDRVDRVPEHREQLRVGYLLGLLGDLQRFVMSRVATADLFLGRIFRPAPDISGYRFEHAGYAIESGFYAS